MQCNIDARGKAARLRIGIIESALALVVLAVAAITQVGGSWLWIAGGLLAAGGAFAIFEARAGWCVVRAMGFRTRI